MDYARTIGKSDQPRIWKRTRVPFVTTKDKPFLEDPSLSEDRRLINWRKWVADRKKQTCHIESITGRSQADQLQSSTERFRTFVEMKNLMEHAAIPVPVIADKYRGGPEFWRTFKFLSNRGDPCLPEIFLTPSKNDLNLPPDLMHVGLSDLIAKERDLTALKTKEELWKRSEYLKTRKLKLAEEIALLLPKEPEMEMLAVKGHALKKKKKQQPRIPPITLTELDEEDEESREDPDQAVVLKIQDREFAWRKSLFRKDAVETDPITWSLTFTSEIDEQVEKEIVLENKGVRVIEYQWRDSSFRSSNMPFEIRGSPFFFNKTRELILPGQIVKIKVWFLSRIRGAFTAFWRLVTKPKLSSSTFIFRFWGCAFDTQNTEVADHQIIEEYLDRNIRDSAIHSIIEEIMIDMEQIIGKSSELMDETPLSQRDLFISLNPYFHYHPNIVMQLQKMYCDVTDESAPPWDLSLDTLRDVILQSEDTNYRNDVLTRFDELCKQSFQPISNLILFDVARSNKYDAVYNVLCDFADLFKDESELIKKRSLMREEPAAPAEADPQESMLSSQKSNNILQGTRTKSMEFPQSIQVQEEKKSLSLNLLPYREIFFIRIYKALEEAIQRACISIDFFNKLSDSNGRKI